MAAGEPGENSPRGQRRWTIAILLGAGVIVSYVDRVILTVAAPVIQTDFQLDDLMLGFLLGAFGWTYGALQVPVGLLLDRFGVRRVMSVSILLWALASLSASAAAGFGTIVLARALLGIAEAPAFPANAKAIGYWFPRGERSLATALFDGAAKISNVIALPAAAFLILRLGWRETFIFTALLSLGYLVLFRRNYRDPSEDRRLGPSERAYIAASGAAREGIAQRPSLHLLRSLLKSREVWGLCLGFGCYSYAFSFFISWLPTYLAREVGVDLLHAARLAVIPWGCASIASLLVGGWLIDRLVQRGWSETAVRKSVIVVGLITALAVIGAAFTRDSGWALFWITLSLSGLAAASPAVWSLPALIAPTGGAGTIGGLMNFAASLGGITASVATGFVVSQAGSFRAAFFLAGAVAACGILFFAIVMGPIAQLPEPAAKRDRPTNDEVLSRAVKC